MSPADPETAYSCPTGTDAAGKTIDGAPCKSEPPIAWERKTETAAEPVAALDTISVTPNQVVLDETDVVFLCLRPLVALGGLGPLAISADYSVVSGGGLATQGALSLPMIEALQDSGARLTSQCALDSIGARLDTHR